MKWISKPWARFTIVLWPTLLLALSGCYKFDMVDQAKQKPLSASPVFRDGRASRLPVEGTVARGQLNDDELLNTGKLNGTFSSVFPFPINKEVLEFGQQRFNIYCSACHDRTGSGHGMVVQRGYNPPPSYHISRLRDETPGYLFDVITAGYRTMPSYAVQVPTKDRWAIVAYIKALQLSQNIPVTQLSDEEKAQLDKPVENKESGKESRHE